METFIHDKLHDDQDHDDIDAIDAVEHVAHANVAHVAPGGLCLDDTTSLDALVSQVCALNSIVDKIKMSIADTLDIMFTQKKTCGDVLNDRIISRVQDLHEDVSAVASLFATQTRGLFVPRDVITLSVRHFFNVL